MKKEWLEKILALGIVVLFITITITPAIGISGYLDDTTPPITTISFNPPNPDGENGWYVSNVTVTLNATDDSGVNITKYRIDDSIWYNYTEPFILDFDGEDILIEFYSIDNAGNQEEVKSASIDIDKTKPQISLCYEVTGGNPITGYEFTFTATATDDTSGMNRVEFYINNELQETVNGSGPVYQWEVHYPPLFALKVIGLIRDPEITNEYIKFFAKIVFVLGIKDFNPWESAYAYDNAGNYDFDKIEHPTSIATISPGIYLFKNLTLPNSYKGYIGKFFIRATFDV